jgi:hypothetical protein
MGAGDQAGTAAPVSFERDIKPLFRSRDIQSMKQRGVLLDDYAYMSNLDNAQDVLDHLTGDAPPRMPLGGPFWSDAQIDLFKRWMNETPSFQP